MRQLWEWLRDDAVTDDLLEWAPDVAALTGVLLERSHAYRFVVSPPVGGTWPPVGDEPFGTRAAAAAALWRAAMDQGSDDVPAVVRQYWDVLMDHVDTPVAQMASGTPWPLCEATLALHAIADEASAGISGGTRRDGPGPVFRARARELLARTGSMARLPPDRATRLPKSRTTSVGITHRSVSRYSCTTADGIKVRWYRAPLRRGGSRPVARHANVLLLPWPLRIRESDFVPVPGSVRRPQREPFGFFEYRPSEPLDLDLVDRLIDAALEEVDQVDVAVMPEGCLGESDLAALERLLARRGVPMLVTGIRPSDDTSVPTATDDADATTEKAGAAGADERFPLNSLHVGLLLDDTWWHYRQNKHHRWFLDAGQIETYNIAGALHPGVRWWEAMEIPERRVQFLELGGGLTVAAVVCEDLARLDGVAQLLRSVGPTLVVTLLLDGPQLASRWTARYASVLADDPGSTVLTLTALGMATRSRPAGHPPSRVVAMWKDAQGLREIAVDPGAQAVLLKAIIGRSSRHAADSRPPMDDVTEFTLGGVYQLVAGDPRTSPPVSAAILASPTAPVDPEELSVITGWAEAIADAVRHGAAQVTDVLDAARPDAPWRAAAGLAAPTPQLAAALVALVTTTQTAIDQVGPTGAAALHEVVADLTRAGDPLTRVAGVNLQDALEAIPEAGHA